MSSRNVFSIKMIKYEIDDVGALLKQEQRITNNEKKINYSLNQQKNDKYGIILFQKLIME